MGKKGEKRRKTKSSKVPNKENFNKKLNEIYERKMMDLDVAFKSAVKSISGIFHKYSVQDIAYSLFVSHIWLPNIASNIKHQFLLSIFVSLKPEEFTKLNQINSYSDFRNFLQKIYPLLPSFVMLEDYVPEPDWGEVKFHHEGRNYKIFYGQELSNVYDYLMLFQMIYVPLDEEYRKCSRRSPTIELQYCLQLQDDIISGITSQPKSEALSGLSPGHIEIPPQNFWENAVEFYKNYKLERNFTDAFLKNYSVQLGSWPREHLKSELFYDMVFRGKVVPAFFISYDGRHLPILPRRYSSILFDSWSIIYKDNHEKVINTSMPYSMRIGAELYHYIKARINSSFLHPLVSAVKPQGLLHEILFSSVFISKDRLVLIYVTNPSYSKQKTEIELKEIAPKLAEAVKLISTSPTTLALHLEKMNVQSQSRDNGELKPELFVIIPQVSTEIFPVSVPESLPGNAMFMDQFLGIVDELESADVLTSFIEYLEEYSDRIKSPFASPLDIFGSFKSFHGVLVEGALDYTFISLDPHWGSHTRFETLSKFWKLYPEKHFFDHPRSWMVTQETESRIRLVARGYFGSALYCRAGSTHIFLNSPFDKMSYKQGQLANLLMECLEDSISSNKALIEKLQFFQIYNEFQVLFFPYSLIYNNDTFKHLRHLKPSGRYWCSDYGLMNAYRYGIRIVFDDKTLAGAFMAANDRSLEIDLLLEVLTQINKIVPDTNITSIIDNLQAQKSGKPHFKMFSVKKVASFPQFVNPHEPAISHFKRAKKKIAKLAKLCNLSEGYYTLEDAKSKLNALRDILVREINSEVEKYDFKKAIPYLLTRVDALTDEYERKTLTIEHSLEHHVDYKREENYAKRHSKYVTMHRNYRYLIEKFVQLQPDGEKGLDKDQFQYLIALIDWLHIFYSTSDSLHYGIGPAGMKVNEHYLVDVEYESDFKTKEREFAEEEAMIKLGLIGNPEDRVSSPRPVDDLLNAMDEAFKRDLGFSFRSMINVLQIMAHWADFKSGIDLSPFYFANKDEIEEICTQSIEGIVREEISPILDFLTLKSEDLLHLTEQDEPCFDLPVWEYRKRYARYNLRPLIMIEGRYYWGPYSTMKSGIIWSGNLSYSALPTDLQSPTVQDVVESGKKLIEDALVMKTHEIIKRFTPYVQINCKLHKLDDRGGHPIDLGDYDVLGFYSDKNIVFNVECKDILPVFCLKDAKRLREKIFGKDTEDEGHFRQINKRQAYLSDHLLEIAQALNWPIDINKLPKIVTIYLTRINYWWTRFPPKEVNVVFLRVDMLSKFIENL